MNQCRFGSIGGLALGGCSFPENLILSGTNFIPSVVPLLELCSGLIL